jgi:ppGpp synthetase/RelA/SpoT-type nucleotidyltranferase
MIKYDMPYWINNKQSLLKDYELYLPALQKVLHSFLHDMESNLSCIQSDPIIKGRIKDFNAFYSKLLIRANQSEEINPFSTITDLIGIRIIVPFLEELELCERKLAETYNTLEIDDKSKVLSVQEFGYDSIHLLVSMPEHLIEDNLLYKPVVCEIQLRTILQDAWAEVEHELIYKTNLGNVENSIHRKLTALNATLSLADITFQEIRDYQKKRYIEIQEKHQILMRTISAISTTPTPEDSDSHSTPEPILDPNSDLKEITVNDIFIEALNAHTSGDLSKARDLYTHLILISPNQHLYNHRGLVNLSLCRYNEALQDFSTAIEMNPRDIRVYTNRGLAYRMLKDYDSALANFNESLKLNPICTDAFYGRALTYYDMGNIKLALEDCDRAIAINDNFVQAMKFKQFLFFFVI